MISFHRVSKRYGDMVALQGIDLTIAQGEWVSILGPSGAGKSTLLRLLLGAERLSEGHLFVQGIALHRSSMGHLPALRRQMGVIFQDFRLLPNETALTNVALPLLIGGLSTKEAHRRATLLLQRMELHHTKQRAVATLSGGEQQRIAVARALIHEPRLILADEPTGNLDREAAAIVLELLEHAHTLGTTILLVTHDTQLLQPNMGRIVTLEAGKLVQVCL